MPQKKSRSANPYRSTKSGKRITRKGKLDGRSKRYKQWKEKFIEVLSERLTASAAADAVGISRRHAYAAREKDPEFAAAWDQAVNRAVDRLEENAYERATHGWLEPVWYKGEEVGTVRKFSNALTIFMLKCRRPEQYRETGEMRLTGADGEAIKMYKVVSPDDWPEKKGKKEKKGDN